MHVRGGVTNKCISRLSSVGPIDRGNYFLTCDLMSFVVTLFMVANDIVYLQKGDKLVLRVKERGSVRLSMVMFGVRCRVLWGR